MAKAGRKKQPTKILKLHGSHHAKGRKDIELPESFPEKPSNLSEESSRYWDEIAPFLAKNGLLSSADGKLLSMLCDAWVEYDKWNLQCQANPLIKTQQGNFIQNPLLSIRNQAWKRYERLAAVFGIGTANRAGIGNVQKPRSNTNARFFNQGG